MRLSFPNGEHPDVQLEQGELTIGSASGNRIIVDGTAPRHATVRVDAQRGILIGVVDRSAQVHVNARPVRELAILRLGDVLSLNRVQVLVKSDHDAMIDRTIPADSAPLADGPQRTAASRVVLRGVAGSYFGRTVSLQEPVLVGRSPKAQIRLDEPDMLDRHAQIELNGERVLLRDLGSHDGSVVNGVPVKDAVLHPGDQIAFDSQRFVLEAPGLPSRGSGAMATAGSGMGTTQTLQAIRAEPRGAEPPVVEAGRSRYGWLIAAALAIAGTIVGLLLYAPR